MQAREGLQTRLHEKITYRNKAGRGPASDGVPSNEAASSMKSKRSNVLAVALLCTVLHPDTFGVRCLHLFCGYFHIISASVSLGKLRSEIKADSKRNLCADSDDASDVATER
jgi:hypothetical protein